MLKKSLMVTTGSAFLFFAGLGSSAYGAEVDGKKIKDTIVYSLTSSPTGIFNPTVSNTVVDGNVNELVYQSMLKFDGNLNLIPSLAESYDISEDGKTITFKIKEGIKWNDGTDFMPEDIIFTLYSVSSPNYSGPRYGNVEKIEGVAEYKKGVSKEIPGIKKIDGNKISITLKEKFAPALSKIGTLLILPKHIWEKYPVNTWKDQKEPLKNLVGTGPYRLAEFQPGQYAKLERNESYSGELAKTKYIVLKEVNLDAIEVELKNGSVDIADISNLKSMEIDDLKDSGYDIYSYGLNGIEYMGLNLRDEKFQDKRVRQALFYGINRQMILDRSADGKGTIVNVPLLPSMKFYPKEGLNPYPYNQKEAKALLKAAGWEDRDGNGVIENKDGKEFVVSLKLDNRQTHVNYVGPIVQKNLKDIGIKVNLENMDFSAVMEQVVGNHNFDMYLMVNMLPVDGDPKPYWHSSASSDKKGVYGWNISAFRNPKADALLEEGLSETDDAKRKVIYKEFAQIMNDEVPWITFYNGTIVKAYTPNLKNFHPVTFLNMLDAEEWYIEEK